MQPSRERTEVPKHVEALATVTVDAAFRVHNELGPGFLEAVYGEALAVELTHRGVSFRRQVPIPVHYRGRVVGESRLDFLVADALVVELKANEQIAPVHLAQVISYLRAAECVLGLLVNFNVRQIRTGIRRVIFSTPTPAVSAR